MSLQKLIEEKLEVELNPSHLSVTNESFMHNVPSGSESHFKVIVVSDVFDGIRLVGRHQRINSILSVELKTKLHALSIETYTTAEWLKRSGTTLSSPPCLGGNK